MNVLMAPLQHLPTIQAFAVRRSKPEALLSTTSEESLDLLRQED